MPFEDKALVVENINLSDSYYLLSLEVKNTKGIKPGQLFSINVTIGMSHYTHTGEFFTFNSRLKPRVVEVPLKLYFITDNILEFYYNAFGDGKKALSKVKEGDKVELKGPLTLSNLLG